MVHLASELASAPIGHPALENASPPAEQRLMPDFSAAKASAVPR
jgi:hypothetical protein